MKAFQKAVKQGNNTRLEEVMEKSEDRETLLRSTDKVGI